MLTPSSPRLRAASPAAAASDEAPAPLVLRYVEQVTQLLPLARTLATAQFFDIYERGFNKVPLTQWMQVGEIRIRRNALHTPERLPS